MTLEPDFKSKIIRFVVAIIIIILIAIIHLFRIGNYLNEDLRILYYSYASDIMIPFGIYFLFCLNELRYKFIRSWKIKAFVILCFCAITEILQAFGYYFLGQTFDVLDLLAYSFGVFLAVIFDQFLFKKFIPYWD
jgi:hypothetical protein